MPVTTTCPEGLKVKTMNKKKELVSIGGGCTRGICDFGFHRGFFDYHRYDIIHRSSVNNI